MAVDGSLETLLQTLTSSIQSATEALPTDDVFQPKEGISLLDVKNELLLSYLQNLVFLILLKIRSQPKEDQKLDTQQDVVQKLVELRVYLEKGVRPLENRLKYNIDKIIRAADDASRRNQKAAKPSLKNGRVTGKPDPDASEAESAGSDDAADEDAEDEMSFAPNKAFLSRVKPEASSEKDEASKKDGIYRPPKITPMAMPTTDREARRERRPGKSATLDEFIATELSSAPIAEPSIGSTITNGGRHTKSERERREENERREYEESNFTRLAPDSKKDKAKKRARQQDGGFGGEEWRSLGAGIDRIEQLTQKKGGKLGTLEKSRKRPVGDGPRGSGSAAGDAFEKRRKVVSNYRR